MKKLQLMRIEKPMWCSVFNVQQFEKRSGAFRFRQNTDKPGIITMTTDSVLKTEEKDDEKRKKKKMQTNGNMYDRCMKGLSDAIEQTKRRKTERKIKRDESHSKKQITNNCNCSQMENGDGQKHKSEETEKKKWKKDNNKKETSKRKIISRANVKIGEYSEKLLKIHNR